MSEQKICPTCGTEYPLSERFCPRDGTALRSANAQADLLGSIVADRYHVIRKLGEGGMGTVYLAEHVKMGRKSALKVMNPGMNTDPDAIARFNREAANASRLSHPNICAIYDFGETAEGMIYLAMEFIEGTSLTSLIEKAGALPPARAGSIVHQVADALQVAHDAGIVHRDLKPDNIMVAKGRDGADVVKVVDFGIAKASTSDAQKVTKTGLVVGTPEYMSPEQLAGDRLDGRSDIYSLGLVAFNCLTGRLPFPAETAQEAMILRLTDRPCTLAEMRPDLAWTPEVQHAIDRALMRDAGERYQGAAQFGREFAAACTAMPSTQAAEAGTLVMGAAAATEALPATRVARASQRTQPMEAPAAPRGAAPPAAARASRNPLPMVLGGIAAVGVAATLYFGGVIGGARGTPAAGPVHVADAQPAESTAAGTPDASATDRMDTATKAADPAPRNVTPMNRPLDSAQPSPGTRPATDPATETRAVLAALLRQVDTDAPSATVGVRVLSELAPIFPALTGADLAEGHYVRMLAYASTEDARVCDDAGEVDRRHTDARKRARAQEFLRACRP